MRASRDGRNFFDVAVSGKGFESTNCQELRLFFFLIISFWTSLPLDQFGEPDDFPGHLGKYENLDKACYFSSYELVGEAKFKATFQAKLPPWWG